MKVFSRFVLGVLCMAIAATSISCGNSKIPPKPADMPNPVSFKVIVQDESGSGIQGADVRLLPEDGGKWASSGVSDASGTTTLKTSGLYEGVVPGKYKVLISKKEIISTGRISEETGTEETELKILLDEKYGSVQTTPFSVEVPAGGGSETFKVGK